MCINVSYDRTAAIQNVDIFEAKRNTNTMLYGAATQWSHNLITVWKSDTWVVHCGTKKTSQLTDENIDNQHIAYSIIVRRVFIFVSGHFTIPFNLIEGTTRDKLIIKSRQAYPDPSDQAFKNKILMTYCIEYQ